ncbi:MAG: zinc ribbon domain-containing protein [Candidatus Lokiarchaeota archaeon]|nr:zinc ribbon domain-containing protein [Candidatus Lokiarchaeota archaeon]
MVNIRICPKCKKPSLTNAHNLLSFWGGNTLLKCKECDYQGYFYLEIDPNEYKDQNEENIENYDDLTKKNVQNIIFLNLCHNCGSKLRNNSNFCFECGFNKEINEKLPSPKSIPKNAKNCLYCGNKIKKRDKYCVSCGNELDL